MKRSLKVFVTLIALASIMTLSKSALCEDIELKTTGYGALVSQYIWRGWDKSANDNAALQGGISVDITGGYTLDIFGSYTLDNDMQINELDYTLSYTTPISHDIELTGGITLYTFPGTVSAAEIQTESTEVFVELSFPKVMLTPVLQIFHDWEQGDGTYVHLGGTYEYPMNKGSLPPLMIDFGFGYNAGQWEPADNPATPLIDESDITGISDVSIGLSMAFDMGIFTVTPSLNFVIVPEERINNDNEFWAGLNFTTGL